MSLPRRLYIAAVALGACGLIAAEGASAGTSCTGSGSRVALDSGDLVHGATAYTASFDSDDWSGELVARSLNAQGRPNGVDWSAEARMPAFDKRTILATVDANNGKGNDKTKVIALKSIDDLKNPQKRAFSTNKDANNPCKNTADDCQARLNYIRGSHANEAPNGLKLRNRNGLVLGDIVHSDPVYVGAPRRLRYPDNWDDKLRAGDRNTIEDNAEKSYADFAAAHKSRTPMVYVGANDGMLHGFDATDGTEKIAYLPRAGFRRLAALFDPDYGKAAADEDDDDDNDRGPVHRYYVDGSPAAGDVVYDDGWHTVLVTAMGRGGKTVIALDITDPGGFDEPETKTKTSDTVLWEFTDPDLGHVHGKPSIVRLHNGQWAALFGNGYDSSHPSTVLYLVAIDSGRRIAKLSVDDDSTGCGDPADAPPDRPGGLSAAFPVDLDGDFITDYVYAGDLQGHLWRFDLTSASPGGWGQPSRVFTACDGADPQPITAAPRVGAYPYGLDYGVVVYVGTGQPRDLDAVNPSAARQNAFYGIWDPDVFSAVATVATAGPAERGDLVGQSVAASQGDFRALSANSIILPPYKNKDALRDDPIKPVRYDRGWRLGLPEDGERVVTAARLARRTLSFDTVIPAAELGHEDEDNDADRQPAAGTPTCGTGGRAFVMVVDRTDGGRLQHPAFDVDGDGDFARDGDTIAVGGKEIPVSGRQLDYGPIPAAAHVTNQDSGQAFFIVPRPGGATATIDTRLFDRNGRVSWRALRR